jgi:hypothetical protein
VNIHNSTVGPVPATSVQGVSGQSNTVNTEGTAPIMPQHVVFGVRTWLGLIALAAATLGCGWLLYTRAEDRIVRLEDKVSAAQAETTKTLADIRVQLATLLARPAPNGAATKGGEPSA